MAQHHPRPPARPHGPPRLLSTRSTAHPITSIRGRDRCRKGGQVGRRVGGRSCQPCPSRAGQSRPALARRHVPSLRSFLGRRWRRRGRLQQETINVRFESPGSATAAACELRRVHLDGLSSDRLSIAYQPRPDHPLAGLLASPLCPLSFNAQGDRRAYQPEAGGG